jgi:hypothetical protein
MRWEYCTVDWHGAADLDRETAALRAEGWHLTEVYVAAASGQHVLIFTRLRAA